MLLGTDWDSTCRDLIRGGKYPFIFMKWEMVYEALTPSPLPPPKKVGESFV